MAAIIDKLTPEERNAVASIIQRLADKEMLEIPVRLEGDQGSVFNGMIVSRVMDSGELIVTVDEAELLRWAEDNLKYSIDIDETNRSIKRGFVHDLVKGAA